MMNIPVTIMVTLVALLPAVLLVVLAVWGVRAIARSRRESVEATASANGLVIEHLRGVSDRLDRIEKQLSEVPE